MKIMVSEILSGIASTSLALAANGTPEASMFAAAVQPMLKSAFDVIIPDISHKGATKREAIRLGLSYKAAIDTINENTNKGIPIRTDNIFVRVDNSYSKADDILEALLKCSMDDTEEKKAEHYGYFFGNLAFCPEVNYRQAILIQKIIPQLTYSHLCLIKLIHDRTKLTALNWKNKTSDINMIDGAIVYHQTKELLQFDILAQVGPFTLGEELGNLTLNFLGKAMYKLLNLDKISGDDVIEISQILDKLCK